jgi:hypothetical protein
MISSSQKCDTFPLNAWPRDIPLLPLIQLNHVATYKINVYSELGETTEEEHKNKS